MELRDKIYLCKQDFINILGEKLFTKSKFYVGENSNLNEGKFHGYCNWVWIQSNTHTIPINGLTTEVAIFFEYKNFAKRKSLNNNQRSYIWNFFYTDKELRKLKLEKIQKNKKV